MKHTLTIVSLHDAQITCTCSWKLSMTGEMTRKEALKEFERHLYNEFVFEWRKNHSISNPPSFTSWKTNYKKK